MFEPFPDKLATYRVIEIPPALGEEARSRFVQAVQTRTQQQAQLAQQCDAVLAVAGDVQKEPTRLIVSHEPAASANLSTILSAGAKPDIETLWWVTWNLVRALRAGQAVGFMHGGIQSASVLRDEQGRIKLADFGLAPAFESVCGRGCRRYVVCSPMVASEAGPGEPSGRWALLSECETGRFDWIACHFAPELLGWENLPLGAGADSFALGVLLFLWATGLHPYNSELPEPTLTCYFRVEPLAFEDENVRPDWKAALKCARDRLATREDRTVITWTGLVRDLLEDNEAKRLVSWGEAEHRILEFIPPAWPHTLHVLRAPGDPETLLREVVPLAEQEALPPLCHVSLVRWLEQQRREAEKRRVDREAQEVLGAARDDIEHFAFDRAREHLELLLRDPMLPAPYRGQAQRLLDEAVRGEGQAAELRGAASDYSEGRLPEALDRLKALLANDSVLVLVSSQARLLADEIEVERREIDECRGTLERARAALDDADLESAERLLSTVSTTFSVQGIARRHAHEAAQFEELWGDLEQRKAATQEAPPAIEEPQPVPPPVPAEAQAGLPGGEDRRRELDVLHQKIRPWLQAATAAADKQDCAQAAHLLEHPPVPEPWPDDTLTEVMALRERVLTALAARTRAGQAEAARAADADKIRRWLEQVTAEMEQKRWNQAADLLARLPEIQYWPDGAREKVQHVEERCKREIARVAVAEKARAAKEEAARRRHEQQRLREERARQSAEERRRRKAAAHQKKVDDRQHKAEARLAAHRRVLDAALSRLEADLARKKRRTRTMSRRAQSVLADPAAGAEQRESATNVMVRLERMPRAHPPLAPPAVGVALVLAVAGTVWYLRASAVHHAEFPVKGHNSAAVPSAGAPNTSGSTSATEQEPSPPMAAEPAPHAPDMDASAGAAKRPPPPTAVPIDLAGLVCPNRPETLRVAFQNLGIEAPVGAQTDWGKSVEEVLETCLPKGPLPADGVQFKLVVIRPDDDTVWNQVTFGGSPGDASPSEAQPGPRARIWHIFYIGIGEPQRSPGPESGLRLATPLEWQLAVLTMAGSDLEPFLWTRVVCQDREGGAWLCGGTRLSGYRPFPLLPPQDATDPAASAQSRIGLWLKRYGQILVQKRPRDGEDCCYVYPIWPCPTDGEPER